MNLNQKKKMKKKVPTPFFSPRKVSHFWEIWLIN